MPYLTAGDLSTMLQGKTEWSARSDVVETLAASEAASPAAPQEVADAADVATVVTALKAMGLFIDPAA